MNPEDSLAELAEAVRDWKRSTKVESDRRAAVRAAIAQALEAGVTQKAITEVTGYTRETIRTIAREHGIPPTRV